MQRLGTSAAEFDQLRGYVEQIGVILADVAKEVAAQDVTTVQRRVDDLAETVSEVDTLRAEVAAVAEVAENLATGPGPQPRVLVARPGHRGRAGRRPWRTWASGWTRCCGPGTRRCTTSSAAAGTSTRTSWTS